MKRQIKAYILAGAIAITAIVAIKISFFIVL